MKPDFSGLDPCVHCGFCLQSCPTFLVTGDEADSPRGRIVLMRALARDESEVDNDALRLHLDRCLGCRGCEPVCPSGVKYGQSLEAAREVIGRERRPPLAARMVLSTMADPNLRRPAMAAARAIRPLAEKLAGSSRVGFAMGMLAATKPSVLGARLSVRGSIGTGLKDASGIPHPDYRSPSTEHRTPAVVFRGCIMEGLYSHVNAATGRTLQANGYELTEVRDQGCCGALHAHAGQHRDAQALARANVTAFATDPDAAIAVNSAGCGAALKEYPRLLAGDPLESAAIEFAGRVKDVSELLAARGPRQGGPLAISVAYDPPCHLLHAQRISREPISLLDAIPGMTQVHHVESEVCCGSAGIYSLLEPELSRAVLARKTDAILAVSPDVVATGNPGCAMQIGAGLRAAGSRVPVVHPVELLDHSYWAAGLYDQAGAAQAPPNSFMTDAAPAPPLALTPDVPVREAEALLDGAVVCRADDQVLEVAGPGALVCMQGLLTNDLEGPGEEGFVYGAVLTPKGMIVCDLWAARFGGMVTLTYPPNGRTALLDIFQRSLPPRLAKTTDRGSERVVLRLAGPTALHVAESAGLAVPLAGRVGRSAFRPSDCLVARPPLALPFALQLLVAEPDVPLVTDALERAGAVSAGPGALELSRILSGWPRLGAEIDQKTLPQEVRYDEINGVSYTKGCYTGQETVARLHFRGHTNRHLVGLTWQDAPNAEQTDITQDERAVGRVSSIAWLAPLDHYVGLGLVRRDTDPERPVTAGGAPARVSELPLKLAS